MMHIYIGINVLFIVNIIMNYSFFLLIKNAAVI